MDFINKYGHLFRSIVFTFFLVGIRIMMTGDRTFAFIPWNTFLAVVPLYFSYKLPTAKGKLAWVFAALWLLFFPNAMYIVTDLFHLRVREKIPFWFDLLILFSAAVNGLIAGFLSLHNTEKWLSHSWQSKARHLFPFTAMLLCGYGIYLGRYERWNSWDVIAQPASLFSGMIAHITDPVAHQSCWFITIVFGIWMYILYGFLKSSVGKLKK